MDSCIAVSGGVWFDAVNNTYMMWYHCTLRAMCLALSRNGLQWHKPSFDVVPGTNIVIPATDYDGSTVWLDATEPDRTRRFKASTVDKTADGYHHYHMRASADGIHWRTLLNRSSYIADRSTIFYNPFRQKWVYSIKGFWDDGMGCAAAAAASLCLRRPCNALT